MPINDQDLAIIGKECELRDADAKKCKTEWDDIDRWAETGEFNVFGEWMGEFSTWHNKDDTPFERSKHF